jgi:hypothetical protein
MSGQTVTYKASDVQGALENIIEDLDLSRYIL